LTRLGGVVKNTVIKHIIKHKKVCLDLTTELHTILCNLDAFGGYRHSERSVCEAQVRPEDNEVSVDFTAETSFMQSATIVEFRHVGRCGTVVDV